MSRLTQDGTAEPVLRDQILRHARGQGKYYFPCSADHEQDWQPYPVDPYSAICDDHTYIITSFFVSQCRIFSAALCVVLYVVAMIIMRNRCNDLTPGMIGDHPRGIGVLPSFKHLAPLGLKCATFIYVGVSTINTTYNINDINNSTPNNQTKRFRRARTNNAPILNTIIIFLLKVCKVGPLLKGSHIFSLHC